MSLHIVLGLADQKPTTEPVVVYVGRSGAMARAAIDAATTQRLLIFSNPMGLPKNNPKAVANAAKAKAVAGVAAAAAATKAKEEADSTAALVDENKRLSARVAELEASAAKKK